MIKLRFESIKTVDEKLVIKLDSEFEKTITPDDELMKVAYGYIISIGPGLLNPESITPQFIPVPLEVGSFVAFKLIDATKVETDQGPVYILESYDYLLAYNTIDD
jgi:co-chaperonin GroES (HSP10)